MKLFTTTHTAIELNKSPATIFSWVKSGKIVPYETKNRQMFFSQETISKFKKRLRDKKYKKNMRNKRKLSIKCSISEWRKHMRDYNCDVISLMDYKLFHVAKYDSNHDLLGYYKNRNQAVMHHFKRKGLNPTSIIIKYLRYNRTMRGTMEKGNKWFGHYYVYVPAENNRTFLFQSEPVYGKGTCKSVVVVSENGNETVFESKKGLAEYLNVDYALCLYYIDSGERFSDKKVAVYTVGKRKYFDSISQMQKYYRLTQKPKFQANKLRGQTALLKTE